MAAGTQAYCTLLTTDEYLPGAVVLAHSLRDNGTKKGLAVLVTLDTVSSSSIDELKKVYDQIIPVDHITNKSPANIYLMNRPDLGSTFTKIALWRLTQFEHIVYFDADMVALRAPDELFQQTSPFAATPDVGWPDCFNSGVLSLKPNMGDYYGLLALADRGISFDGADQGLLNMHFREWERLSFTYNCTPSGNYQYVPAYRHFQSSINMVHYIGHGKPWVLGRDLLGATEVYQELLGRWWAVYDRHYRVSTMAHISGQDPRDPGTVQQYVAGEAYTGDYGFSSFELQPSVPPPSEVSHIREKRPVSAVEQIGVAEPSITEDHFEVEESEKGELEPAPTVEQRRYSVDWNPAHQPPPPGSKPEAADLPTETYKMSEDPSLFRAPKYPEPPKNMYYQVPENPPAPESKPPPPIFPWEEDAPKATRIFLEDVPAPAPPPETLPEPVPPQPATSATTGEEQASPASPTASTSTAPPTRSFEEYSRTNAWDDVPEINRYISRLPQNRRGKLQILFNKAPQTFVNTKYEPLISPPVPVDNPIADSLDIPAAQRLTDFPTEIERPSLPVTPAPVRRPSFWGSERDKAGDLPGAEDVPEVSEWDPAEKLKELVQRHSEALERGEVPASAIGLGGPQNSSEGELPRRKDIASASVLPEPRTSGVPQEDPVPKTEDKPDINTEEGVEKEEVPLAVESSIVSDSAIAAAAATSAEDTAIEAALPNAATAITAAAEA